MFHLFTSPPACQAQLQSEGGEEALAPRQVASDHWSTPAPAGQLELEEWKRARVEQTAGMLGQRQVAAQEILHIRLLTCSLANLLACPLACLPTYLLTHLRVYSLTHVSLQAAAEKVSADVARTAVLARRRLEQEQVRKATRLQL